MPRTEYFEIVAKSALNRVQHMGFKWSLNPYQGCYHTCVYCFARAHAKLADRDPGAGFSARVGVKVNLPELLRGELSGRSWKRETVAFGTATDPYQPIEGTYRLTRRCLEALRDFKTPIGLITKGTMVIRDIDVLAELSRRAQTTVCLSIPTADETVWANIVYLKPGTKEHFMEFLDREYPHLLARYHDLFPGAYAPAAVKAPVIGAVGALKRRYEIGDRRAWRAEPPSEPVQLGLAV